MIRIPPHQELRLPLLQELATRGPQSPAAATQNVAKRLGLSRETVEYRRPLLTWSAQGLPVLQHRLRSVFQRLFETGLVKRTGHGMWAIRRCGVELIAWGAGERGNTDGAALLPPVLDACCGARMFWFDRADARAVFLDKRRLVCELPDRSSRGGKRTIAILPDVCADFTALPYPDESFSVVVFDPPHLARNGPRSWLGNKYGTLRGNWRDELRRGFVECFRVLKPRGTLVFKWNEHEIPVSEVLALTPEKPLVGNRCGKASKSHWILFLKGKPTPQRTAAAAPNLQHEHA